MGNDAHEPSHDNEQSPVNEIAVDAPPDGGYGWVCLAACFTINCFTWGVVAVNAASKPKHDAR